MEAFSTAQAQIHTGSAAQGEQVYNKKCETTSVIQHLGFEFFLHLKVIWSMPRFIWSEEQLQKRLPKIRLRFFFGVVLQIQFLATDESL